jgi:hypothetical protein
VPYARALGVTLAALGMGCVDIHGGAVEVAWAIYASTGRACCPNGDFCRAAQATTVTAHLHPETCAGAELTRGFPCHRGEAASGFDIPPGLYCITIDAVDTQGQVIARGPAPLLRQISTGDVSELGAVALTLVDDSRCPLSDEQCP